MREERADGEGGGKCRVPWISIRERPVGVWRRGGSGFGVEAVVRVDVDVDGGWDGGWSGIVGILVGGGGA